MTPKDWGVMCVFIIPVSIGIVLIAWVEHHNRQPPPTYATQPTSTASTSR